MKSPTVLRPEGSGVGVTPFFKLQGPRRNWERKFDDFSITLNPIPRPQN